MTKKCDKRLLKSIRVKRKIRWKKTGKRVYWKSYSLYVSYINAIINAVSLEMVKFNNSRPASTANTSMRRFRRVTSYDARAFLCTNTFEKEMVVLFAFGVCFPYVPLKNSHTKHHHHHSRFLPSSISARVRQICFEICTRETRP